MAKEFLSKVIEKIMAKKKEKRTAKEREKVFVENGSKLLEKLIATCNGKSTPIRNFSYKELKRATNSFHDSSLVEKLGFEKRYKGSLEGRNVLIETIGGSMHDRSVDRVINEIAISAMMSVHGNILRLIGCCLETQVPYAVFEFPTNGTLFDRIHHVSNRTQQQYEPMAWSSRLRIAREAAHAISYLHTGFSTPIIHRNIKPLNIFLDQHDVAKLSSFQLSILIPQGKTYVEDVVCGTLGYICPEYYTTAMTTDKVDVFAFGMVLFELLTGQRAIDFSRNIEEIKKKIRDQGHDINEIVDPTILQGEGGASISIEHQLQAMMEIALACTEINSEIRPTMVDVTKQLRRIEKSVP